MPKPRAVLFDAYGTLFDVHAVTPSGSSLSQVWRQKQLEYTWLHGLMGTYEDFARVTESALRSAIDQLAMQLTEEQVRNLLEAYFRVPAFEDVRPALESLKRMPLAILSNGSPKMLDAAVRHNGLESFFTEILSVDEVRTYKPSPRVYALGTQRFKLAAEEILFVSSNWWDAAGAKAFGYRVCWCNRSGAPREHFGVAPDLTVDGLNQIMEALSD
ncbi:MAG TPA: haloacid dehalogenase type II [Bryobacteraceae bacterium]|nr:haloacid dehalogenase type II [Bryobacteraceae bacterium]